MIKYIFSLFFILCQLSVIGQLRVKTATNDLGDIFEENGVVVTSFQVENPYYRDTIKITNIHTSCGCTAIISTDTLVYPRQTIDLKVSYDPTDRIGLFQKTIHIETLTAGHEKNSLYLKIIGNVIGHTTPKSEVPVALIDYKVAPIIFFPISVYDTSYFDLNRVIDFANDITFEIDYYNFTTVGIEIRLKDKSLIEDFENLASYLKRKLIREMLRRQYAAANITFIDPVFVYDNSIPAWSAAKVKVYSEKFNDDTIEKSVIKTTNPTIEETAYFLLDYNLNIQPTGEQLVNLVDYTAVNTKLFKNGKIAFNAVVYVPESLGKKEADNMAKVFKKEFFKKMKASSGISKNDFSLVFDTIATHANTKYKFQLYDKADMEAARGIKYVEKPEDILPPLLPTYKTRFYTKNEEIDVNSIQFNQFWNAIIAYTGTGKNLSITLESSSSKYPKKPYVDPYAAAQEKGEKVAAFIKDKYYKETGKTITVNVVTTVQGPEFETKNFTQPMYFKYEYVKLIPIYLSPRHVDALPIKPKPYIVNYDYYYIGIDTTSKVLQKFAEYVAYEIQTNGFVELRTESSASNLIVDNRKSNEYWAYSHLEVSKERFYQYLKSKLIDPNRVIITNEKIVVQGIPFDPKTPVVRYRNFQYVTFVPKKYL
ncbi:MAG: DUF1573 domain-containing protein [Putridiphycobacter sp.]|nr:DUF1573 domain-containing protein [Putridiphycobacter sp.]